MPIPRLIQLDIGRAVVEFLRFSRGEIYQDDDSQAELRRSFSVKVD